jgi:hypothetical protein
VHKAPGLWLKNVWQNVVATLDFHFPQTTPDNKTDPRDAVRSVGAWKLAVRLDQQQAPFLTAIYVVTLIFPVVGIFFGTSARDRNVATMDIMATAMATATIVSLLACCTLVFYCNRMGMNYIGMIVFCNAYAIHRLVQCMPRRGAGQPA